MKKCPYCEELIDDNASVCPICGEELTESQPSEQANVTDTPLEKELRECPICGEMISSDLDICDICGEPTHFHDIAESPVEYAESHQDESVPNVETPAVTPVPLTDAMPEQETEVVPGTIVEEVPVPPVMQHEQRQYQQMEKKSTRNLFIVLLALLILALLGVLYFLFFTGDQAGKMKDGDELVHPMDTIPQDPAKVKDIQAQLDSLERQMNEDVVVVAKYPDGDRACMYYLFNGELFKYDALNGTEETVSVPMDAETDIVSFAEPEGDGQYIKIDMANENMEHTASYHLNTLTGKILREKEGGPKPQEPPAVDNNNPREMPPPPPMGGKEPNTKGAKGAGAQEQAPPPPARNKVRQEQRPEEDVPPPPPSNGPGYRLEPINKGDIPNGNNNGGYHF